MSCTSIDVVLKGLDELQKKGNLGFTVDGQIQELKVQFRFIRIFTKWRPKIKDFPYIQDHYQIMEDQVTYAETQLFKSPKNDAIKLVATIYKNFFEKHGSLERRIYNYGNCYFDYHHNSLMGDDDLNIKEVMMQLINPLQENMKYLLRKGLHFEEIRKIEEKLGIVTNFLKVMEKEQSKMIKNVLIRVRVFVENVLVVSYLCSMENAYEEMYLKRRVFDLLLKIKHVEPDIRMIYVEALKASKRANPGSIEIDVQAVLSVDSLLDDLKELIHGKSNLTVNQIKVLFKELRFLKDFLMDPQLKDYMEPEMLIPLLIQIEAMAKESRSVIHLFFAGQLEYDMAEEKSLLLDDLLKNVNLVKAEIRQIYLKVPKPSLSNYPKTQKLGFVDLFLENLDELLAYRCDSITFVENDIETIQSELVALRRFLWNMLEHCKEAEELQDVEHHLTSLVYEAECVVDLIIASNGPIWYYMLWLSDVTQEIKLLKTVFSKMDDKMTRNIAVQTTQMASNNKSSQDNTSVGEVMVGFKDQTEMLKDQLQRGSQQLHVVSIIGMPGLGKTTLAKKVYDDPSITSYFHLRSWCCISQVYERRRLLLDILNGIVEFNANTLQMSDDDLVEKLYKNLRGRKYLIILDDIWNIEAWNQLRICFPDDNNGSRIMLTSRERDVALLAEPGTSPHFLRLFTEEESWELLQKKVFQEKSCPPELSVVGMQIAKRCKRLPLSVVVVAGLLKEMNNNEDHWKHVAESLGKHIVGEPGDGWDALELSYKNLPCHLKPCFLYLGIFPEDREIPVQKLKWLWIAEGFVCKTDVKCLEDVAEGYLVDLVSRSMVIVAKNRCNGGVKTCRIHDLLREFCLEKAKQENFLLLLHGNEKQFTHSHGLDCNVDSHSFYALSPEQHRMCIYSERDNFYEWRPSNPHVRSLLLFAHSRQLVYIYPIDFSFISNLKLLRVLDLLSIRMGYQFPAGIELLVHLRYLALRGGIHFVPSFIGNLRKLETFTLKGLAGEVVLPYSIWKMARLRHLRIDDRSSFESTRNRHENFQLDNLKSLSTPALCFGDKFAEKMLRRLPRLTKLRCIFLESWDLSRHCNRFPVLDFLSELESLKVLYHGMVRHPCEFSFPSNLKKLSLSRFQLPWCEISRIGRLPNLEALKLLSRAFEGQRWDVGDGEFQNLKFLKLDTLNISQWNASSDHFPKLQHIVVHGCKKLEAIPSCLGELPTLHTIHVHWCSDSAAKSVRQIHEEQRNMGNDGFKVFVHPPVRDFTYA